MSEYEQELTPEGDRSSDPLSGLLQSALAEAPEPKKSLLPGIQERIRIRTKGRYYRDRWSTAKNPISLLLMVSLLIMILAAATFLVIQPLIDSPKKTKMPSAPLDPMAAPASPSIDKNPE